MEKEIRLSIVHSGGVRRNSPLKTRLAYERKDQYKDFTGLRNMERYLGYCPGTAGMHLTVNAE